MPYPVSPTELRIPAHGGINAADRVRLTTLGFTGERADPVAPSGATLTLVAASAYGDLVSRTGLTDAVRRGGGK